MDNLLAFLCTLATCAGFIGSLGLASRRKLLDQTLSRKVMHIGRQSIVKSLPFISMIHRYAPRSLEVFCLQATVSFLCFSGLATQSTTFQSTCALLCP